MCTSVSHPPVTEPVILDWRSVQAYGCRHSGSTRNKHSYNSTCPSDSSSLCVGWMWLYLCTVCRKRECWPQKEHHRYLTQMDNQAVDMRFVFTASVDWKRDRHRHPWINCSYFQFTHLLFYWHVIIDFKLRLSSVLRHLLFDLFYLFIYYRFDS